MHLSIDKPSDASTVRTLGLFGVIAVHRCIFKPKRKGNLRGLVDPNTKRVSVSARIRSSGRSALSAAPACS